MTAPRPIATARSRSARSGPAIVPSRSIAVTSKVSTPASARAVYGAPPRARPRCLAPIRGRSPAARGRRGPPRRDLARGGPRAGARTPDPAGPPFRRRPGPRPHPASPPHCRHRAARQRPRRGPTPPPPSRSPGSAPPAACPDHERRRGRPRGATAHPPGRTCCDRDGISRVGRRLAEVAAHEADDRAPVQVDGRQELEGPLVRGLALSHAAMIAL